MTKLFISTCLR